jgi:probable lipoprotein NlpC
MGGEESRTPELFYYSADVSVICHTLEHCREIVLEQFAWIRQMLRSRCEARGWIRSVLLGTALFLLTGCQSTSHSNPPTRPTPLPDYPRKTITPAAWKLEADRWLGVKYRKGGMDRAGIDCSGLTIQIYRVVADINLPRTSQDQSRYGRMVTRKELIPGDLIFFTSLGQKSVDHVGIYLGDLKFVHASPSKGVVVSSMENDYYKQRYHSARRVVP